MSNEQQLDALRTKLGSRDGHPANIVTVATAAQLLHRPPATIRGWLHRGLITSHGKDESGQTLVSMPEIECSQYLRGLKRGRRNGSPPSAPTVGDILITAAQAARWLGLAPSTISNWKSRGWKNRDGVVVKLVASGVDEKGRDLFYENAVWQAYEATSRRAGR